MYFYNALSLLIHRNIGFRNFLYCLKVRPIAVCGRGGSFIVDPDFDL